MATLLLREVHFAYPGAEYPVFSGLNLTLNRRARIALAGRNGRGKTTLLKLLAGELAPDRGTVEGAGDARLFRPEAEDSVTAFEAALKLAGPYRAIEQSMEAALAEGSPEALARYGALLERYERLGGYEAEARLAQAFDALALPQALRAKPLKTLSGGERTRAMIAGLFVCQKAYPLIDEPTNHLDRIGREQLAEYLEQQSGFLLVSHDRRFLDRCTDHTLVLNQDDALLLGTRFSRWRQQHQQQLAAQEAQNLQLRNEIKRLDSAAQARRAGAEAREKEKSGALDKGYVGARAARQMKRALSAERRAAQAAAERRQSLHNVEKHYPLSFRQHSPLTSRISAQNLTVLRPKALFAPISFELKTGQRLAIEGANGSGKSTLLALLGSAPMLRSAPLRYEGVIERSARLPLAVVRQEPAWRNGRLRDRLRTALIDESRFRQVLAALGLRGAIADQPIEQLSHGQQKKFELARAMLTPSELLLWDEPLNFLDIEAREALEEAITLAQPTMVIVEHDAEFLDRVATERIQLQPPGTRP